MKAEKKIKHRIDSLYPKYLLIPVVLIFIVFFIIPVIGGVFISFTNWDITRSGIKFIGLDNYVSILKDSSVQKAIKNTLIFTISIVLLRNVFALALAVALCKNLKTKTYLRTVFYIPAILSYVVVGIMFNALFQMDGTINQILQMFGIDCTREWVASADTALFTVIVEDVWKWTGFHMIIYIAGITAIPQDFYEASRIDGASS
ncbi:MAG: sugar ABC transporter permease [Eubacteriales bacterium]|nr:sugar ABC transporter permease [Eubacteriales bacterium]